MSYIRLLCYIKKYWIQNNVSQVEAVEKVFKDEVWTWEHGAAGFKEV